MDVNIKIQGLAEFKKALYNSPQIALPEINRAIQRSIQQVGRTSVPLTPYKKGALRRSLITDVKYKNLYGEINPRLKYAYKQHEGYYRHKYGERKYLEKGAQRSVRAIKEFFEEAIERVFKKIKAKV